MGFNPFSGRGLVTIATGGLSEVIGEDTMSRVPVLNAIGGYESDAQKALIKTQQEMAADAKKRQEQNAQARMNALGQSLLAFNPQNQMLAQMFGPQAAFSPQQFAQMAADPRPQQPWGTGTDQERRDQVLRKQEEERRQRMLAQGMQPLGPGPAPLRLPPPQAARKY